ncbi:MAG TPA: SRPBCC domain-containing protein [Gemmatimonadaceae bacterium]|jgi:uncharacterized protein YndB with AHSA1/START domain|nr:SRPBCC domain-containing protein [Gemmatimonadaceae bacterium]
MTSPESPAATAPDATGDQVRATVEIAATPEEVFEALTDPAQLEEWWGTPESYRTSEWQLEPSAGGEWSVRTTAADGSEASVRGEYRVVDPPHTLELTWAASWDDFVETTVRFDLVPTLVHGVSGTRLTVTHSGLAALDIHAQAGASFAVGGRYVASENFALDWTRLLASFALAMRERVVLA